MTQKFLRGDRVHVGRMPSYMSHFDGNVDAIVLYSYRNMFGCGNTTNYCLYILPNVGSAAWYEENQLKLLSTKPDKKLADKLDPPSEWIRLIGIHPWTHVPRRRSRTSKCSK